MYRCKDMNHSQCSDTSSQFHDNHFTPHEFLHSRIHFQTNNLVDKLGHTIIPPVMSDTCRYQLNTTLQNFDSVMRHNGNIYVNSKTDVAISTANFNEPVRIGFSEKKNNYISINCNQELDAKILHKNFRKQENEYKLSEIIRDENAPALFKSKFMVDVGTMTDPLTPEEQERLCQWEGFAAAQSGNKVAEYLTSLRKFLQISPPTEGRKRQGLGDVRIVTAPDGSRFFCCSECHMAYPDKSTLEQHLGNHKVERRFICITCGAGLKRKEHLDRHQLSHSAERPYTCDSCPKTFKRNEHLARHYIVHSGEKSQVCIECGKAFYRRDHLQKHAQGHITKRLRLAIQSTVNHSKTNL